MLCKTTQHELKYDCVKNNFILYTGYIETPSLFGYDAKIVVYLHGTAHSPEICAYMFVFI